MVGKYDEMPLQKGYAPIQKQEAMASRHGEKSH